MSGNPGFEHPLTRYLRRQLEAQREQREPEEEPAITLWSTTRTAGNSLGSDDLENHLILIFNQGHWVLIQRRHWTFIVESLDPEERMEYMEY
jgi:hypothetical protein